MLERKWVVGPFQCNCRLLACPKTGDALLIDPGDEAEKIIAGLAKESVQVKYLLHTHGHLDHIAATKDVKQKLDGLPQIAIHRADEEIYNALKTQGGMFGLKYEDPTPVDVYLEEGQELQIGQMKLTVIHTPGHSPGSVCFRLHEDSAADTRESLFSGDTLFQGSVGRTDLWGADQDQMFKSIRQRILTLDGDTRVCPGHGPDTSVGVEKTSNPFLI